MGSCTTSRKKIPSLSDVCSSTRNIDACTETHINRLYAATGKIIATRKIPLRAAGFRKEGATRIGLGTGSGSRDQKPTLDQLP